MKFIQTDWDKYRIFYFVAKNGTLTQAAKVLQTTQPSLSRNIMDLEQNLGKKLFKRSVRGMVLTEQGEELSKIVHQIFGKLTQFEEKMHTSDLLPQGILSLAVPNVLPSLWITKYDSNLKNTFPKLHLSIVENTHPIDLTTSSIEAQIGVFQKETQELEQIYITTCTMGLFASRAYEDQSPKMMQKEDLDKQSLIGFNPIMENSDWDINWHLHLASKNQKSCAELWVNSAASMIQAAEAGYGIASLPIEYGNQNPSLIRVLPEIQSLGIDLYYMYPQYHKKSQKILAYQRYLCETQTHNFTSQKIRIVA